jgi:hypothetical protein
VQAARDRSYRRCRHGGSIEKGQIEQRKVGLLFRQRATCDATCSMHGFHRALVIALSPQASVVSPGTGSGRALGRRNKYYDSHRAECWIEIDRGDTGRRTSRPCSENPLRLVASIRNNRRVSKQASIHPRPRY